METYTDITKKRLSKEHVIPCTTGISIFLAIISGFVMASAQELFLPGAKYAAFIGIIPLLIAVERKRTLSTYLLAHLAFFVYLIQPLVWISQYGVFALIGCVFMESAMYAFAVALYGFIRSRRNYHDPWYLTLPMLIAVVELKRAIGPWAFPFTYFAHTQTSNLIFIQGASLWGAIGVSFIVVWINVFIYNVIIAFPTRVKCFAYGIPLIIVLLFNFYYGQARLNDQSFINSRSYPLTIAQRKTATDVVWSGEFMSTAWTDYERLTRNEIKETPQTAGFVLWPENAVPDLLTLRKPGVQHLSNTYNKSFIVGTLTWKPEWADYDDDRYEPWFELYNSVSVINPVTGLDGSYSKVHLVPFGETIPLRDYIALLEYPWGDKNLSAGKEYTALKTPIGEAGAMICYESFFPQIPRKLVLDGAKYLFLVSNTSWFGDSIATYQHSRYDVYRAIENNCYFGRAATTGVSSIIDPRGNIIKETRPFEEIAITSDIHPKQPYQPFLKLTGFFPLFDNIKGLTPYTIFGDWVAYISLIWLILTLMQIFRPASDKHIAESIAYIED